jgi:hypothetical protein
MADLNSPSKVSSKMDDNSKEGRWDRLSKAVDPAHSEQIYRKTDYHQDVEREALANMHALRNENFSTTKSTKGK